MTKEEWKHLFREHYGDKYLELKEEQMPGFTEATFLAFCVGYKSGYLSGRVRGYGEGLDSEGNEELFNV